MPETIWIFTRIAAASYFVAAAAFAILSVLLLTRWRARLHGVALAVACVATAAWGASTALQALRGQIAGLLPDILELVRNAAWSFFLLSVLEKPRDDTRTPGAAPIIPPAAIASFYLLLFGATVYLYATAVPARAAAGFTAIIIAARVALAVLSMLLVEQLYRNTPKEARWSIKFACLGIGGLFAYDVYLYSDAMLFRQIHADIWAARGVVAALTVPLIVVSATRSPGWSTGITVSRTAMFHSVAVFGSAVYLLTLAGAGYYLRLFGGTWGTVMQLAFLFGAGILLFAVLFSGSVRAWLKVFISKHFYHYRFDYRDEWIRSTRALSDAGPHLNERTVQAVAMLMESPAGILFLRQADVSRFEPAAHWNMSATQKGEPPDSSLCRFLETRQWVVDLQEYASNPGKYEGLALPDWLRSMPKAWLVVPLLLGQQLIGFIVLAQARSTVKLNWEATDLLKIVGTQAASYLAQRASTDALMAARQFESYTRMSTFIVHDLKNLISQLSLLLANAEKHRGNLEFQSDMLETIDFSVQKMKLLLQKLGRGPAPESNEPVALSDLVRQAVGMKSAGELKPTLRIDEAGMAVLADRMRLERVLGHLIQNAIEATPRGGSVAVRVLRHGERAMIEVQDSGHGMTQEFIRDRLFKPFESTKPTGMGIGAFESRAYIRQLGGDIEVNSKPSTGTTFRVMLPIHQYQTMPAAAA